MDRIRIHETFLQTVATTRRETVGKILLKEAKPQQLDAICEIILNLLKGNIPLEQSVYKKTAEHKNILRKLAKKCLKKVIRKKLFIKYFKVIKKLLAVILPSIGITLSALQLG